MLSLPSRFFQSTSMSQISTSGRCVNITSSQAGYASVSKGVEGWEGALSVDGACVFKDDINSPVCLRYDQF